MPRLLTLEALWLAFVTLWVPSVSLNATGFITIRVSVALAYLPFLSVFFFFSFHYNY